MSKVEQIEIRNGDFSIENFSSEIADLRFEVPSGDDTMLRLNDKQCTDLKNLLEVYLKSREE